MCVCMCNLGRRSPGAALFFWFLFWNRLSRWPESHQAGCDHWQASPRNPTVPGLEICATRPSLFYMVAEDWTPDHRLLQQALCQLSYLPNILIWNYSPKKKRETPSYSFRPTELTKMLGMEVRKAVQKQFISSLKLRKLRPRGANVMAFQLYFNK